MSANIVIQNVTISLNIVNNSYEDIFLSSNDNHDIINKINEDLKLLYAIKKKYIHNYEFETSLHNFNKIQSIQSQYEKDIMTLKEELNNKTKIIEKIKCNYEEEINLMRIKFTQSITNLNSSLDNRVSSEIKHIEEKYKIKEEFYQNAIRELKEKDIMINTIHQDNTAILNLLQRPKSTVDIGNEGELIIYNILQKFISYNTNARLENMANNSMSGDLKLTYDEIRCCIEVKNFKEDVSTNQIDKFYRDLHKNSNCYNSGIIISIKSGFVAKSGISDMEIRIYDNKPVIYLSNIEKNKDKLIMSIHVLNRIVKMIKSGFKNNIQDFLNQFRIQVKNLEDIETQIKVLKQTTKNIEDNVVQSKTQIFNFLKLEDLEGKETNLIEAPCGRKYKGVTKNYKNHLLSCEICSTQINKKITM